MAILDSIAASANHSRDGDLHRGLVGVSTAGAEGLPSAAMRTTTIGWVLALGAALAGCGGASAGDARCRDTVGRGGAEPPPPPTPPASAAAELPPLAPSIVGVEDAERRDAPNGQASVAFLARGHGAFVGRLEMAPEAAVPEHQDATEEYIHVLEGHGTITIDGTEHEVGPGTTIFMPAGATVSYRNGDERMVALQVFAGPEPANKYNEWSIEGEGGDGEQGVAE